MQFTDTFSQQFERGFAMMAGLNNRLWSVWLAGLGSMAWAGERGEDFLISWLQQAKTMREETYKVSLEMLNHMRENQKKTGEIFTEACTAMTDNLRWPFGEK